MICEIKSILNNIEKLSRKVKCEEFNKIYNTKLEECLQITKNAFEEIEIVFNKNYVYPEDSFEHELYSLVKNKDGKNIDYFFNLKGDSTGKYLTYKNIKKKYTLTYNIEYNSLPKTEDIEYIFNNFNLIYENFLKNIVSLRKFNLVEDSTGYYFELKKHNSGKFIDIDTKNGSKYKIELENFIHDADEHSDFSEESNDSLYDKREVYHIKVSGIDNNNDIDIERYIKFNIDNAKILNDIRDVRRMRRIRRILKRNSHFDFKFSAKLYNELHRYNIYIESNDVDNDIYDDDYINSYKSCFFNRIDERRRIKYLTFTNPEDEIRNNIHVNVDYHLYDTPKKIAHIFGFIGEIDCCYIKEYDYSLSDKLLVSKNFYNYFDYKGKPYPPLTELYHHNYRDITDDYYNERMR